MVKNWLEDLGRQPRSHLLALGFALVILLGVVDYLTGYEISFSIFYSLPISLVAWFVGRSWAISMSALSAATWLSADLMVGHLYSHAVIPFWNAGMRMGYFLIITYALCALKKALEREKKSARMDGLTGIANGKYFYELAHTETYRSRRYGHPVTLAYLDMDNFKLVNDEHGHAMGDELLRLVASSIRNNLRLSDIVGRLGGDEFAILLPETGHDQAPIVMNGLQKALLDTMQKNGWPVTISIGVVTFQDLECTVDEMIKMADDLVYYAKNSGKNMIKYDRSVPREPRL